MEQRLAPKLHLPLNQDILNVPNNPAQWDDPGLNPVILVPLPEHITTCEELMAYRDSLFPAEPEF